MIQNTMKQKAGSSAAEWVKDGMIVGLGTGSTVFYFIERLIERCKSGLQVQAVSSSIQSSKHAQEGGIPLIDINTITGTGAAGKITPEDVRLAAGEKRSTDSIRLLIV